MLHISDNYQANLIETFSSTKRYLDDLLNINNLFYTIQMVNQIYPTELQLNKAIILIRKFPFWTWSWS